MLKGSPLRRYRLSRISWFMILLGVLMFASIPRALAHRVILFAYAEGDKVFTESYFSDGKRCQDSRIEVFDSSDNKLLEGKTDRNGQFAFKPPKKMDLRIVLTASMGHRDEYVIPAKELQGGSEGSAGKSGHNQASKKPLQGEKGKPTGQLGRPEVEQIRAVVEEALDEKLKPIMRLLAERRNDGVSFVGVMGGIGFIFGIMGIILYFKSRRGR
jgi:nickel transport protein